MFTIDTNLAPNAAECAQAVRLIRQSQLTKRIALLHIA